MVRLLHLGHRLGKGTLSRHLKPVEEQVISYPWIQGRGVLKTNLPVRMI
jgi:hypothetical protein